MNILKKLNRFIRRQSCKIIFTLFLLSMIYICMSSPLGALVITILCGYMLIRHKLIHRIIYNFGD